MSGSRKALRAGDAVAITANRLSDGVVVWRTASGAWSTEFGQAGLVAPDELEPFLKAAQQDERLRIVVGTYAAPVSGASPATWRERIRAFGPTV